MRATMAKIEKKEENVLSKIRKRKSENRAFHIETTRTANRSYLANTKHNRRRKKWLKSD